MLPRRHSSDSSVHFQGSDNVLGHHRYSTERAHRHFQDKREGIFDFLQQDEGVLHADMDLEDCIKDNQYHDVVGGYQRLDVFDLKVDRTRRTPNTFVTNREHQAHDATSPNPKNASMNGAGYN
ncbi:nitrilase [Seiridium cupressi]